MIFFLKKGYMTNYLNLEIKNINMGIFDWFLKKKKPEVIEQTIELSNIKDHINQIKNSKYSNMFVIARFIINFWTLGSGGIYPEDFVGGKITVGTNNNSTCESS